MDKFDVNDMVDFFAGTPARVIIFDENGPQKVKKVSSTSEEEFGNLLSEELYRLEDLCDGESIFKSISTFEDEMDLTNDKGLIIKLKDGSEFLLNIKRRK